MDWAEVREKSASYFAEQVRGLKDSNDVLNFSINTTAVYCGPIDWGWGSDDEAFDTKLDEVKAKYLLQCNQVELLLREASALIERCADDAVRYDDLNTQRFKTMIEFVEYHKIYLQQQTRQYTT